VLGTFALRAGCKGNAEECHSGTLKRPEGLLLSLKPLTVCFAFVLAILLLCWCWSTIQALWHAHYPEPISSVRLDDCVAVAGTDTGECNNNRRSKAEPVYAKRPEAGYCFKQTDDLMVTGD
jgi:hypothetical protein